MKSILLASASAFAFAGAAAADGHSGVSFGGEATVGYNDDIDNGFYYDANLGVTFSATLDNGLTASATFDIDVEDGQDGALDLGAANYVLMLSSDMASLTFGDTDPAGDDVWGGVDGSEVAGFADYDVHTGAGYDAILRGDVSYMGVDLAVSFGADTDGDAAGEVIDALQVAATGTFGNFTVVGAYQQETIGLPQVIAASVATSFAGADVMVAFENDGTETSYGASLGYPIGPVSLGAYATQNDVAGLAFGVSADYASGPFGVSLAYDVDAGEDAGEGEISGDATYDVGNGLMVLAGATFDLGLDDDSASYYGAVTYDLGGGASFLASYAMDQDNAANDEIGGPEYKHGLTAELSFEF